MNILKLDSQVILLTSTEEPYFRDVLDLIFYPAMVHYRLRYNRKWVSKELKLNNGQLDKNKIELLIGRKCLITHVLIRKNEKSYEIQEFLPIREAVINDVVIIGEFIWMNLMLGDWIFYHKESLGENINEHHEKFILDAKISNMNIADQLVLLTNKLKFDTINDSHDIDNTETLNNWTRIVNHISRFSKIRKNSCKNVIFLKFVRIKDINNNKVEQLTSIDNDKIGFELKSKHSYAIDIVEYTDQKIEPFELEMKVQKEIFSPNIEKSEIRGKYDVLHFQFFCKPVTEDNISTISFETLNDNNIISKPIFWAKVKTRKWVYTGVPLLFFALSTFFTSEQFLKLISNQNADIGFLVFGVIGTIGSTISLLYLKK